MAPTYLDAILAHHRERAARDVRDWRDRLDTVHCFGPSMHDALGDLTNPYVKVIAEVKRRSPSKGWLNRDLDATALATSYQLNGASAVSVLTDEEYFGGSRDDLEAVASVVSVPILRKDFTVSANDVLDAAQMGASAVLLIVAALEDTELIALLEVSALCGLDALVEVHDRDEARRAVLFGARMIGVNQRNLRTFEVDQDHAASVITSLPPHIVAVAESGLRNADDVRRAAAAGFDAVLVGETFVTASEPSSLIQEFCSIARVERA